MFPFSYTIILVILLFSLTNSNCRSLSFIKNLFADATCVLGAVGKQLGSDQVAITDLTFTPATTSATRREFEVTLTGHLVDNDAALASISRTIKQTVFVRSVGE